MKCTQVARVSVWQRVVEQPSPAPTPLHHDVNVADLAARRTTCSGAPPMSTRHILLLWFRMSLLYPSLADIADGRQSDQREGWSWRSRPRMLACTLSVGCLGVESEEAQPQPVHVSQEGGSGEGGKRRNRENDCVTDGDRRSQKSSRKRR